MNNREKLKPALRIMIFVVALPGIFLIALQFLSLYLDGMGAEISEFPIVYGSLAMFLSLVSLAGRLPSFLASKLNVE
jgi:uncharacterized membrane protein YbhN (UPF0104 family)